MHRLTTTVVALLALWLAAPSSADAYVRLAYQPESKSGEFRVGHRITQTTGVNAGSIGRIIAGGDSTTRAGYSLIVDTTDTFDSGAWVNDPFTGGQVLVEYVGGVRTVAAGGGADDTDIGDAGDGQCWQASACGDVCLITEAGNYDLPHDGTGFAYDQRISIYALEGIAAVLRNDEAASPTLQTDMSGAVANRGWLEFVGVKIEQQQNDHLWSWTNNDDEILFSRVQFDYNNAGALAYLFDNAGNDASDVHVLDCWNTTSGAGATQRIFAVDQWTDYLIRGCMLSATVVGSDLTGRGIIENCILTSPIWVLTTGTNDGNTLVANNIFITSGAVSVSGMLRAASTTTTRRIFVVNNSFYAPAAGANPIVVASSTGETVVSGNVVEADGNATAYHAKTAANQRLYDNCAYNVAALTSTAAPGTWVQDNNSTLTASPFVAPAAAPPDLRLNSTAGGGADCQGIVRRLPIVSPDTDITGYPRDREPKADAGAWQYRDLVRMRLSSLPDDDADFSGRLVRGVTSGAIGLVRAWDDRRIWVTDASGVRTSLSDYSWGSAIIDVISGTFSASESVATLPDDYSDIPVGMWGGPFAPKRGAYEAAYGINNDVVSVSSRWSSTVRLADYLTLETARAASGALDVVWVDDSEQYSDDLGTCSAIMVTGAPWHLPEIAAPASNYALNVNVGSVELARLRFAEKAGGTAGIYSAGVAHHLILDDCEVYGVAGHTTLIRTNQVAGRLTVRDSLLFAQDALGIRALSAHVHVIDSTVDYATQALYVPAGRNPGHILVDRSKFWETDSASGGIDYDGVNGDVAVIRNTAMSARASRGIYLRSLGMTVAGGSSILVEGISFYNAGAAGGDDGIFLQNHDEAVATVRGCVFDGPVGLAGHALYNWAGAGDVTSEYNTWHNFASGFTGNWSDTGTVNQDPLFADVTAAPIPNLYPSSTSPVLGLVDNNQTSNYDIDGRRRYRRSIANDAGAYERLGTKAGGQRTLRLFLGYGVEPQPGQTWFEAGDIIWSSGGVTGSILAVYGDDLIIEAVTSGGTWTATHTVQSSSGATGTIVAVGDIHTVSPRRDRDSALAEAGVTAASDGDLVTLRDGWVGAAPTTTNQRNLFVVEPIDMLGLDAHPVAHARRLDPLRGRYVGARGAAAFDGAAGEWLHTAAGSTDGWQGWAGLVLAGHASADADVIRATGTGRLLVRDCLLAPQGQWAAIEVADFLSATHTVHLIGAWFRDLVGLTAPANVGLNVQARLPDTAVTGTVVHRDTVHEDVTEHALYQDAAVAAYDIAVRRCLFRRFWATVINMTAVSAARLNVSLSEFYGAEQPAPYATVVNSAVLRGAANAELLTAILDPVAAKSVRGLSLHNTAVATGLIVHRDNDVTVDGVLGADASVLFDSIIYGTAVVPTETDVLENTDPLLTDADPDAPDAHFQDASRGLGLVNPAHLQLIAPDAVDFHGFPVFAWTPNIHAGALQHPVPGRVPRVWGGMHKGSYSGGLRVPLYTR